jgi:hypothetical protein
MGAHVLVPGDPAFAEFQQNSILTFSPTSDQFCKHPSPFTCTNSLASGSLVYVFSDAFYHPALHPSLSSTEAYHE